jgi:AcrR family transcriptional regulator
MADVKYAVDRRSEILKAAREVLAEKGLEATKISEIVARAGVAQGTFYLYFPSKTSLVLALVEEFTRDTMEAVITAIAGAGTLAEVIDRGVRAAFARLSEKRDIAPILRSRIGLTDVRAECERLYQPFYDFITLLIRQGQEAGELNPTLNPLITARLVAAIIDGAADQCFVYGTATYDDEFLTEVVGFICRALGVKLAAD